MKRLILGITFCALAVSCSPNEAEVKTEKQAQPEVVIETEVVEEIIEEPKGFNYENFKIQKGQLGDIKVGMTISEAEEKIEGLRREKHEAYSFGFDGGGLAYIYYYESEPVLALVPTRQTDTILVIVAASPELSTTNGLNPNSSVGELLEVYPYINTYRDLMMSWEFAEDSVNDWDFVFMNGSDSEVSEYEDLESPGTPVNLKERVSWIIIR